MNPSEWTSNYFSLFVCSESESSKSETEIQKYLMLDVMNYVQQPIAMGGGQPPNQNNPSANPIFLLPVIRKCVWDPKTQALQTSVILGQIIKAINETPRLDYDIDLGNLALALGSLNTRFTKTIGEIILEYRTANKNEVMVMGRSDTIPYDGRYDKANNSTSFDLQRFPDSLVLVLQKFIEWVKVHSTSK